MDHLRRIDGKEKIGVQKSELGTRGVWMIGTFLTNDEKDNMQLIFLDFQGLQSGRRGQTVGSSAT